MVITGGKQCRDFQPGITQYCDCQCTPQIPLYLPHRRTQLFVHLARWQTTFPDGGKRRVVEQMNGRKFVFGLGKECRAAAFAMVVMILFARSYLRRYSRECVFNMPGILTSSRSSGSPLISLNLLGSNSDVYVVPVRRVIRVTRSSVSVA